jgi:hypothetical protein
MIVNDKVHESETVWQVPLRFVHPLPLGEPRLPSPDVFMFAKCDEQQVNATAGIVISMEYNVYVDSSSMFGFRPL